MHRLPTHEYVGGPSLRLLGRRGEAGGRCAQKFHQEGPDTLRKPAPQFLWVGGSLAPTPFPAPQQLRRSFSLNWGLKLGRYFSDSEQLGEERNKLCVWIQRARGGGQPWPDGMCTWNQVISTRK